MLDTIIRSGTVVDGTGAPARRADVGVRDGRIVAIGEIDEPAKREINAAGKVVSPGFIDVHTHYDAQLQWDPFCSPAPLHGVTTVIAGNCGLTLAPFADEASIEWMLGLLSAVEQIPIESLRAGVDVTWHTFGEFLDDVDGRVGINVGFLAGHAALRRAVMGDDASTRAATAQETTQMADLLRTSIASGALGFSTSGSRFQIDAAGRPSPTRMATSEELIALAGVCSEFEGTRVQHTPATGSRGWTDESDRETLIAMAVAAQRTTFWLAPVLNANDPGQHERALAVSDAARARGAEIYGQFAAAQGATPGIARFDLIRGNWLVGLPGMDEFNGWSRQERLEALQDPSFRAKFKHAYHESTMAAAEFLRRDIEGIEVNDVANDSLKHLIGRRVSDIAAETGVDTFDAMLDIAVQDDLFAGFLPDQSASKDAEWNDKTISEVLTDPRIIWGSTDSGAHVVTLVGSDFAPFCLKKFVRDDKVLTLEQAIHQMTGRPAAAWGLKDRGRIQEGACADLVIFDPNTIAVDGRMRPTHDYPEGGMRVFDQAIGIDAVLVNGRDVVRDGKITGDMAGSVLRSGKDTVTRGID